MPDHSPSSKSRGISSGKSRPEPLGNERDLEMKGKGTGTQRKSTKSSGHKSDGKQGR